MFTKEDLQEFLENLLGMIRWLIVAGITGVLVGLVGVLFGKGMTFVNGCRAAHPWIIWLLPVGGEMCIRDRCRRRCSVRYLTCSGRQGMR